MPEPTETLEPDPINPSGQMAPVEPLAVRAMSEEGSVQAHKGLISRPAKDAAAEAVAIVGPAVYGSIADGIVLTNDSESPVTALAVRWEDDNGRAAYTLWNDIYQPGRRAEILGPHESMYVAPGLMVRAGEKAPKPYGVTVVYSRIVVDTALFKDGAVEGKQKARLFESIAERLADAHTAISVLRSLPLEKAKAHIATFNSPKVASMAEGIGSAEQALEYFTGFRYPAQVNPSADAVYMSDTVVRAQNVTSLTLNPSTVQGMQSATATVTVSSTSNKTATLTITSSNTAATVPGSVILPAGSTSVSFTVTTADVVSNTSAIIKASLSKNNSAQNTLTINADPQGYVFDCQGSGCGGNAPGAIDNFDNPAAYMILPYGMCTQAGTQGACEDGGRLKIGSVCEAGSANCVPFNCTPGQFNCPASGTFWRVEGSRNSGFRFECLKPDGTQGPPPNGYADIGATAGIDEYSDGTPPDLSGLSGCGSKFLRAYTGFLHKANCASSSSVNRGVYGLAVVYADKTQANPLIVSQIDISCDGTVEAEPNSLLVFAEGGDVGPTIFP